mmetsp:Transcript_4828/g.9848  ORF Transcript_4828/g.9848 Transcript_4828/m.9848 type:complete len:272 (+) Transcript_4828:80-895(+)
MAAFNLLPENTGNECGELVLEERDIRISEMPGMKASLRAAPRASTAPSFEEESKELLSTTFISMTRDPDVRRRAPLGEARREGHSRTLSDTQEEGSVHQQYLARASKLDVTDIGAARVLFKCGFDFEKRPVVVLVGAHLDPIARANDLERFLLYAVKEMQPICTSTYSIVYLHAEVSSHSGLELGFVRRLHAVLGENHKDNLKALFVVHPTLALRASTTAMALLGAGISKRVWTRAIYVDSLRSLFQYIPEDQLYIPEFVYDHDRQLQNRA